MPPAQPGVSFIGRVCCGGWFGFNAGSALARVPGTSAFVPHTSPRRPPPWLDAAEWIKNGRAARWRRFGSVAGCGDHAGGGFVAPMPALAIGFTAGLCATHVTKVKAIFGYDDALMRASCTRGGTHRALLTGVFAQQVVNPIFVLASLRVGLDGIGQVAIRSGHTHRLDVSI